MNIPIFINDVSKFDSIVNKYIVEVNETNETLEKNILQLNILKLKIRTLKNICLNLKLKKYFQEIR